MNAAERWIEVEINKKMRRVLLPDRGCTYRWDYSIPMLEKLARSGDSVLITGETGTGKEGLARFLHERSVRRAGDYVSVNCTGLSEQLLRSELFGHRKGSFTGAESDSKGAAVRANGGTLFLDEIANMDKANQGRLLRFLETREAEPVGGERVITDVRVIAATNKVVEPSAEASLIPDLYHRFDHVIELPPLRDRGTDIFHLLVSDDFLGGDSPYTGITLNTLVCFASARWPGNIRQLHKFCRRQRLFPPEPGFWGRPLPHIMDATMEVENGAYEAASNGACRLVTEAGRMANDKSWALDMSKEVAAAVALCQRFGPLGLEFDEYPPGSVVPLNELTAICTGVACKYFLFDFSWIKFDTVSRPGWLGRRSGTLDFVEALALLGFVARGKFADHEVDWSINAEASSWARALETDFPRWPVPAPPPPRNQASQTIEAWSAQVDLSRLRSLPENTVREVLILYGRGLGPAQILRQMNATLTKQTTIPQIRHIIRTYAVDCPRAGKPRRGRQPSRK